MHAENIVTEMRRASLQQKNYCSKTQKTGHTKRGGCGSLIQEIKQIQQLITIPKQKP